MTSSIRGAEGGKFESPIAAIVKPLYKALLSVDKDKIKALSIGTPSNTTCLTKDGSVGGKPLVIADVNFKICGNNSIYAESLKQWEEKIVDGALTKGGAFKGMSDGVAGGLGLAISLIVLCGILSRVDPEAPLPRLCKRASKSRSRSMAISQSLLLESQSSCSLRQLRLRH